MIGTFESATYENTDARRNATRFRYTVVIAQLCRQLLVRLRINVIRIRITLVTIA